MRSGSGSSSNFGNRATLMVKHDVNPITDWNRKALVKFKLIPNTIVEKSLQLRLFVKDLGKAGAPGIKVSSIDNDDWSENDVTWDNLIYDVVATTSTFGLSQKDIGKWITINIGSIIRPLIAFESSKETMKVTLLVEKVGKGRAENWVTFHSSEDVNSPQLVVSKE